MFPDRVVTVATKCHKNMQKSSKSPFNMHVVDTRKKNHQKKSKCQLESHGWSTEYIMTYATPYILQPYLSRVLALCAV